MIKFASCQFQVPFHSLSVFFPQLPPKTQIVHGVYHLHDTTYIAQESSAQAVAAEKALTGKNGQPRQKGQLT